MELFSYIFLAFLPLALAKVPIHSGPVEIETESGDKCVPGWRTCPCSELLDGCTTLDSYGRAWCATEVDPITRVYSDWDWCDQMANCTCMTESKKLCKPFNYNGRHYKAGTCTFEDSPSGKPWCATVERTESIVGPSGGQSSNWDYCNENCGIAPDVPPKPDCPDCPLCLANLDSYLLIGGSQRYFPLKNHTNELLGDSACGLPSHFPQDALTYFTVGGFIGGEPFVCDGIHFNNGACYSYSFEDGEWRVVANFTSSSSEYMNGAQLNADQFWLFSNTQSLIYTAGQGFSNGPSLPFQTYRACMVPLNKNQVVFVGRLGSTISTSGSSGIFLYQVDTNTFHRLADYNGYGFLEHGCGRVIRDNGDVEIVVLAYQHVYIYSFSSNSWRFVQNGHPGSSTWHPPVVSYKNTFRVALLTNADNKLYQYDPESGSFNAVLDVNTGSSPRMAGALIPITNCDV